MTTQFEREIREQPDCFAHLLNNGRPVVEEIARAVQRFAPTFVVTAARGSSDNAARYAKYLFGAHNRLVVSLGAPSLVTLYGSPPDLTRALVIGISQSGESPDIVALLEEGRRQGALTVAITNQQSSPLQRAADHAFDLGIGIEHAVVASKSYTGQLLALAMLSVASEGETDRRTDRWRELAVLPEAARRTIALNATDGDPDRVSAWAAPVVGAERMVVIGRGFNFATAFEIALKIKETAYVMAEAYATPDLFHGPLAMVEPGFPAVVVAPAGATLAAMAPALEVLEHRGAHILAISDDVSILSRTTIHARLPFAAGVPEWLSPLVAAIPGQLCALQLAQARGLDPDKPRGLSKVTRTR